MLGTQSSLSTFTACWAQKVCALWHRWWCMWKYSAYRSPCWDRTWAMPESWILPSWSSARCISESPFRFETRISWVMWHVVPGWSFFHSVGMRKRILSKVAETQKKAAAKRQSAPQNNPSRCGIKLARCWLLWWYRPWSVEMFGSRPLPPDVLRKVFDWSGAHCCKIDGMYSSEPKKWVSAFQNPSFSNHLQLLTMLRFLASFLHFFFLPNEVRYLGNRSRSFARWVGGRCMGANWYRELENAWIGRSVHQYFSAWSLAIFPIFGWPGGRRCNCFVGLSMSWMGRRKQCRERKSRPKASSV